MASKNPDYTKIRRAKMVAKGLCRCGRELPLNKKNCQGCLDQANARNRERREAGLCYCGGIPAPNRKQCQDCLQRGRTEHSKHRDRYIKKLRVRYNYLKEKAYEALSPIECAGCGITAKTVLSVDHKNGDGYYLRQVNGSSERTYGLYKRIMESASPKDAFQLLCHNCQRFKGTLPQDEFLAIRHLITWGPKLVTQWT